VLGLIAAATLIASVFLTWVSNPEGIVAVPGGSLSADVTGLDTTVGVVVLVCGGVALIGAVAAMVGRRVGAVLLSVAGLASISATIYAMTATSTLFTDAAVDQAASTDLSSGELRSLVVRAFDEGILSVDLKVALFVALAAGVLALVAGVMAMIVGRRRSTAIPMERIPGPPR
jgi:hypothetical protein